MNWVLWVGGSGKGDVLEIKSHWSGERRGTLLQLCGGGGGVRRVSVFIFVSCSPHRDDNQLTSQCFKLSSLRKEISESP